MPKRLQGPVAKVTTNVTAKAAKAAKAAAAAAAAAAKANAAKKGKTTGKSTGATQPRPRTALRNATPEAAAIVYRELLAL